MKLPSLIPALLVASTLAVFSGCASVQKISSGFRGTPVAIASNPSGATVKIDGSTVGASPVTVRLSTSRANLVVATKSGSGSAAAIVLPASMDQPTRLFLLNGGLSEVSGYSGTVSLDLTSSSVGDSSAMLSAVHQADMMQTAGKLTDAQHKTVDRLIEEYYTGK